MNSSIMVTLSNEDIKHIINNYMIEHGYMVDNIEFIFKNEASYNINELKNATTKVNRKCFFANNDSYPNCENLVDKKCCSVEKCSFKK